MSKSVIVKCWVFRSSSGIGTYQTLKYNNGSTSCECPGWTRRVDALGRRSCKHTRSVELGTADMDAVRCVEYGRNFPAPVETARPNRKARKAPPRSTPKPSTTERVFRFD